MGIAIEYRVPIRELSKAARAYGMTELAARTGIARAHLYQLLSAKGNPTFLTLMRIANVLGFTLELKRIR